MILSSSVLIVDRSDESREVLRTALERRNLRVFEATRAVDGLSLAREHHPDLIVLDLDSSSAADGAEFAELAAMTDDAETQLVILGSARLRGDVPAGEFVAKPYHYRPLILKIERLLRESRQAVS